MWNDKSLRLVLVPGKETLSILNTYLQEHYGITISVSLIVDSFRKEEVPDEMAEILSAVDGFRKQMPKENVR